MSQPSIPSFKHSLWRKLNAFCLIVVGCLLQWILIGGVSPLQLLFPSHLPQHHLSPIVTYHDRFQMGMIAPRWGPQAYGRDDATWHNELLDIYKQTGAQWVEMTINLYQPSLSSTDVLALNSKVPPPQALIDGIHTAHSLGYRVMVVPLLTVGGDQPWGGSVHFSAAEQTQVWFTNYWLALAPYVQAADQAGAESFAIGTEFEGLQTAPTALWDQLIAHVHTHFRGSLSYDMNWSSLFVDVAAWMRNPFLTTIGVSTYIPLTDTQEHLDPALLSDLWATKAKLPLDTFAARLGKPILLAEVGFRNRTDALFEPWLHDTPLPEDPQEQAAAYNAVLSNILTDPHILGAFFWAWSIPVFQPSSPTTQVLHKWFTHPSTSFTYPFHESSRICKGQFLPLTPVWLAGGQPPHRCERRGLQGDRSPIGANVGGCKGTAVPLPGCGVSPKTSFLFFYPPPQGGVRWSAEGYSSAYVRTYGAATHSPAGRTLHPLIWRTLEKFGMTHKSIHSTRAMSSIHYRPLVFIT